MLSDPELYVSVRDAKKDCREVTFGELDCARKDPDTILLAAAVASVTLAQLSNPLRLFPVTLPELVSVALEKNCVVAALFVVVVIVPWCEFT